MSKADEFVQAFSAATKAIAPRLLNSAESDPIFAAIEAHRKAFLDWGEGSDENIDRLGDIEKEALNALLDGVPTTLAGAAALSRYSAELTMLFSAMDYSRSAAHPTDEKKSVDLSYYIHRHVADAVSKLTALPAADTQAPAHRGSNTPQPDHVLTPMELAHAEWEQARAMLGQASIDIAASPPSLEEDPRLTEAMNRVDAAEWKIIRTRVENALDIRLRAMVLHRLFLDMEMSGPYTDNRHQMMLSALIYDVFAPHFEWRAA